MKRGLDLYLDDILESIDMIQAGVEGLNEEEFKKDEEKYESVVYRFAIIGEAINKIPKKKLENFPNINWTGIVSMRNILIHEYHDADLDIVWDTIQNDLGDLKEAIGKIGSN